MLKLLPLLWHEFWFHPDKARLWLRSLGAMVGAALVQVAAAGMDAAGKIAAESWSAKEWAVRIAVALVPALVAGVSSGPKVRHRKRPVAAPAQAAQ